MKWLPIVLIGLAGFLAGGVGALWKTSRAGAMVLGVFALGALVGGILWLIG